MLHHRKYHELKCITTNNAGIKFILQVPLHTQGRSRGGITVHDNINGIIEPVSLFTDGCFEVSIFSIATCSLRSLINHLTSLI